MELPTQLQELLPIGYSYRLKKWTSFEKEPTHFESVILTNIYTEEEADDWMHEFNIKSNTTMRVRATCPKIGKVNTFKIYLRCLHQGRAEKAEKQENSLKSKSDVSLKRNTNCPAGMVIAIRRVIKYSRSKMRDPVDPIHPCEIQIRFVHNHPTSSADSLRFRPVSREAEYNLLCLYEMGHSPASALETLKIDLQIEHGPLFSQIASDRCHCPDKSFCYRLYYKHFGKDYAASVKKDVRNMLHSKVSHYNDLLGETCLAIGESGLEYVVAACTPLMKRSHSLVQCGDIIYVELYESPTNKGHCEYYILLLYAHTSVGGVPLGAILSTDNSKDILTIGFQLLKQLLPDQAFSGQGISGPHAFLVDECENLKLALNAVWPNSDVIVCIFRILQSMWRWLWDEKHNILKDHRLYLLYLVKTVLFASTDCEMTDKYQSLCADNIIVHYPTYLHQIESLWQRRHLWGICFHRLLPLQGASNYYEAAVRALKDKIFEQTKSFNIIQLLNYLSTRLDLYYKTKFLDILQEKISHIFLSYFPNTIPSHIVNSIKQVAGNYFIVPSETGDKFYTVDAELNVCSCPNGMYGALCIHQYWIYLKMPSDMFKADISNSEFKQNLLVIASGPLSSSVIKTDLPNISSDLICGDDNSLNSSTNHSESVSEQLLTKTASNVPSSDTILANKQNSEISLCPSNCSMETSNSVVNTVSTPDPEMVNSSNIGALIISPNFDPKNTNLSQQHSGEVNEVREWNKRNECSVKNGNQVSELNPRMTKVLEKFENFCKRIKDGLKSQPEVFLPALEIMMKTVERKGTTQEQIISGLTFFGIVSASSTVSTGKKRPASAFTNEEIVPKVHGRQMITYEKKKSVNQTKSIPQPSLCVTPVTNVVLSEPKLSSHEDR